MHNWGAFHVLDVSSVPVREPTFSGSATRFYEHLAAGRPMIATPNVRELQSKEPYVSLANDGAAAFVLKLHKLEKIKFCDGHEETWGQRAKTMLAAL